MKKTTLTAAQYFVFWNHFVTAVKAGDGHTKDLDLEVYMTAAHLGKDPEELFDMKRKDYEGIRLTPGQYAEYLQVFNAEAANTPPPIEGCTPTDLSQLTMRQWSDANYLMQNGDYLGCIASTYAGEGFTLDKAKEELAATKAAEVFPYYLFFVNSMTS